MRIEVLYFPGCPHRSLAVEEIEEALACEKIQAAITEIEVRNEEEAVRHLFWGSPTVRVNGLDVAPNDSNAANFSLRCRLYPGSEHPGVPPRDLLRTAIRNAAGQENS